MSRYRLPSNPPDDNKLIDWLCELSFFKDTVEGILGFDHEILGSNVGNGIAIVLC